MPNAEVQEFDLRRDGRVVHAYDTGPTGRADELVVGWHGGTPNTGTPPEPLFAVSVPLGIRWIGADRPGYGGSTPDTAATLATAVGDLAAVADALGIDRFATLGHSGGGPRALATAGLLPGCTIAAVALSSPAPWGATGLDWFDGVAPGPARELAAALRGREELEAVLADGEWDPEVFTPCDHAALQGEWSWFDGVVQAATRNGMAGFVQDDLAAMAPWGFDLGGLAVPVRIVHGADDRMIPAAHARWLAARIPGAVLDVVDSAGHIGSLEGAPAALRWVRAQAPSPD